ncbi:MAG: GTP-binding protein, partial [Christensenellaceae bacterium]
MKDRMKLAVIGGFLGSGKTTAILDIAKKLMGSGIKVGIVTNDQGSDLVDTNFLRSAGFPVLEVDGGCFCCNFDEFVRKLNTLARENLPDIILAEPVGSCTDLVASIFKPMQMK